MTASILISRMAFPALVLMSLSITSAIMSGASIKLNFSSKTKKTSKRLEKLNKLQIKLDYGVSCNGDITEAEYQALLKDFEY